MPVTGRLMRLGREGDLRLALTPGQHLLRNVEKSMVVLHLLVAEVEVEVEAVEAEVEVVEAEAAEAKVVREVTEVQAQKNLLKNNELLLLESKILVVVVPMKIIPNTMPFMSTCQKPVLM